MILVKVNVILNLFFFNAISRYLSDAPYGKELLQQLIEHMIMNSRLWIRADKKVRQGTYITKQDALFSSFPCIHRSKYTCTVSLPLSSACQAWVALSWTSERLLLLAT